MINVHKKELKKERRKVLESIWYVIRNRLMLNKQQNYLIFITKIKLESKHIVFKIMLIQHLMKMILQGIWLSNRRIRLILVSS